MCWLSLGATRMERCHMLPNQLPGHRGMSEPVCSTQCNPKTKQQALSHITKMAWQWFRNQTLACRLSACAVWHVPGKKARGQRLGNPAVLPMGGPMWAKRTGWTERRNWTSRWIPARRNLGWATPRKRLRVTKRARLPARRRGAHLPHRQLPPSPKGRACQWWGPRDSCPG